MIGDYAGAAAIIVMVALIVAHAFHVRDAHRLSGGLRLLLETVEETEGRVDLAIHHLGPLHFADGSVTDGENPDRDAAQEHEDEYRPADRQRSRRLTFIGASAITLVIAAAVLAVVLVEWNTHAPSYHRAPVRRGTIIVEVLNATTTTDLAARAEQRIVASGFHRGIVGNAAGPKRARTVIAYFPGRRDAGLALASALRLKPDVVAPLSRSSQAALCAKQKLCTTDVVIDLGADFSVQNEHS